ncbi:Uncharacterised protein [Brucella melitensis]|nr:Uncharacterised protein [Brucella melitensis]
MRQAHRVCYCATRPSYKSRLPPSSGRCRGDGAHAKWPRQSLPPRPCDLPHILRRDGMPECHLRHDLDIMPDDAGDTGQKTIERHPSGRQADQLPGIGHKACGTRSSAETASAPIMTRVWPMRSASAPAVTMTGCCQGLRRHYHAGTSVTWSGRPSTASHKW